MQQSQEPIARTGIAPFDEAPAVSAEWVFELEGRLGWRNREKVYGGFIATLHALRDVLPFDEAVYLGAELPALLRGFYYEGWHPREKPSPVEDRDAFLTRIHEGLHRDPGIDPEELARAVFALLAERISTSEMEDLRAACPASLHGLWP